MATASSLHSRRFANRITEATYPFISFRLRQQYFALPLQVIQRVGALNSNPQHSDLSALNITAVGHQNVNLVDVAQQIFSGSAALPDLTIAPDSQQPQDCLIIFKNNQGETRGLAIDSRPQLHRIPASHCIAVPPSHSAYNLKCVSAMVAHTADTPDLLLLDLNRL